jgi:hypothetical protein
MEREKLTTTEQNRANWQMVFKILFCPYRDSRRNITE